MLDLLTTATIQSPRTDVEYLKRGGIFCAARALSVANASPKVWPLWLFCLLPSYLAFGSFLSMNAFEPVFWLACGYILVRILKGGDGRAISLTVGLVCD